MHISVCVWHCGEFGRGRAAFLFVVRRWPRALWLWLKVPGRRPGWTRSRRRRDSSTPICGAARWVCKLVVAERRGGRPRVTLDQPPHTRKTTTPTLPPPVRQHLPSDSTGDRATPISANYRVQTRLITDNCTLPPNSIRN